MLGAHDIVWLNGPWGGVLEDPFASQWANLFPEYPYEEDDDEDDDDEEEEENEEEDEREESEDGEGEGDGEGDGEGAGESGDGEPGGEAGGESGAEASGEAGAEPQPSSPESSGGGPEPFDPDYIPPSTPDEWGERNDVPGSAIPINTADPPDGLQGPDGSDGFGEDWWSNQPYPMQGSQQEPSEQSALADGMAYAANLAGPLASKLAELASRYGQAAKEFIVRNWNRLSDAFRRLVSQEAKISQAKPLLRQQYEQEVKGLQARLEQLRAQGKSWEETARELNQARREIAMKYRELTPENLRQEMYERNLTRYLDKNGPTTDLFRREGKSWEEIARSACKTGGKDLGF